MRWVALVLLVANLGLAGWLAAGAPGRPQAETAPPKEMGQLTLLDEMPAEEEDTAAAADEGACYTVGPFEDADRARRARERLAGLGLEPSQRRTSDEEVYGYQVVLPPFPSREEALAATRALAEQGINEYFIISEPERENAVSLGLFREKRYAVRHTRYLRELGFEPEMQVRTRTRTRYWQDYRDPEGRVTPGLLESLAAGEPLQRLERACD